MNAVALDRRGPAEFRIGAPAGPGEGQVLGWTHLTERWSISFGGGAVAGAGVSLFFTSDHHFGHGGARGLFKRPFAATAEMDAAMVARWNDTVGPDDEVWHLGDFAVRQSPARMGELLGALAGIKHLILGNNDGPATAGLAQWASVQHYAELEADGTWLVLCHYPLRTWNRIGRGALNLHGHSHGRLAPLPRQVDVGVDCWDFRPITLRQIHNYLRGRSRMRRNERAAE